MLSLSRSDTSKARPPNPAAMGFCSSNTARSDNSLAELQSASAHCKASSLRATLSHTNTFVMITDDAARNADVCSSTGRTVIPSTRLTFQHQGEALTTMQYFLAQWVAHHAVGGTRFDHRV